MHKKLTVEIVVVLVMCGKNFLLFRQFVAFQCKAYFLIFSTRQRICSVDSVHQSCTKYKEMIFIWKKPISNRSAIIITIPDIPFFSGLPTLLILRSLIFYSSVMWYFFRSCFVWKKSENFETNCNWDFFFNLFSLNKIAWLITLSPENNWKFM